MKKTFLFVVVLLSGCAGQKSESQRSRDFLNCVYHAQYDGNFTLAQREKLLVACRK